MSTPVIAMFIGVNSGSTVDVVVPGAGPGGIVPGVIAGDKIVQVLTMNSNPPGQDVTQYFVELVPDTGVILQKPNTVLGSSWQFMALLSRG